MQIDNHTAVSDRNSVNNDTVGDVIGNKTDNHEGTSIYPILEILEDHSHEPSRVYPTLANGVTVTAAAGATINRLSVLLMPGDIFAQRKVAPVLQQFESAISQDISVNDCFKPV